MTVISQNIFGKMTHLLYGYIRHVQGFYLVDFGGLKPSQWIEEEGTMTVS